MKTIIISISLFCLIFVIAIPMKMESDKLADLIFLEKSLEDSISNKRYELYLLERSIDSLASRNRIDSLGALRGLGVNETATKITGQIK